MSAWKDKADERITNVLQSELSDPGGQPLITGWLVIANFIDSDGEQCVAFNSMMQQSRTFTLGQLEHALTAQKAEIFWDERPE